MNRRVPYEAELVGAAHERRGCGLVAAPHGHDGQRVRRLAAEKLRRNASRRGKLNAIRPELEIGFNAQYLLDFLRAIPQDEVAFALKDQKSAGEMRPAGEQLKDHYRYVVMPMRI